MHHIALDKLGFTTSNGLVHDLDEAKNNVERLYIEEVKRNLVVPADAVFFRRFYKNEESNVSDSSVPAVCIFNQDDSFFNSKKHKILHAELWSAGKVEIYVILGETRVDIINARKPALRIKNDVSLEHNDLLLASESVHEFENTQFSAHLFTTGTFWEQSELQQKIDGNSAPYDFLLDYLMVARKQLLNDSSILLEVQTIDRLLITSILIKFLEDIKDDAGKHTLKNIYKKYNVFEETFESGLRNGKCINILEDLAGVFNGKIFDTFSNDEKAAISQANLIPIANFLSANIDLKTNQGFLWEQYSFKHLPAEVISAIYENFIQAEANRNAEVRKDVVYTPLHLVNLMIDEAMPLDQPELFQNKQFKVLDPACGSGVFLVAAYKRMLQWWAINHWIKTKKVVYPDKETAKEILENNIFGVDIEEVAALVSIFGLTTAFLDKLTPKEIWNNLKFKDLSQNNIRGLNFTDWANNNKDKRFDLVIGNPPFNPSTKGTITNEDLKKLFGKKEVPGNKLALKFFEAALYFGNRVCMILPSNNFLYGINSQEYRNEIFTKYTVEKIYDFTHLRRDLFHKTADTPVVSLLVQNMPSTQQAIEHIVVKRQLLSERKLLFEIDYYDKYLIRWEWAIDPQKQFIWKTSLLGGGRLFHLVYRLSILNTLKEFLKEKDKSWIYSTGYKVNDRYSERKPADFITNKDTIKANTLGELGYFEVENEKNKLFAAPRRAELFANPHIVIGLFMGKSSSKFPIAFIKEHICFNNTYIGISSPVSDEAELSEIFHKIYENPATSDLYKAFILGRSSRVMVSHETSFLKEDIDNLPYPQDERYLKTSKAESIIIDDVLKYYRHLGKGINEGDDGSVLHSPIKQVELGDFGVTFCDSLNEIYAEDGKSWQPGKVIETPTLIIYQFGFGKDGDLKYDFQMGTESIIHTIMENTKLNTGVRYKRITRFYQHEHGFDCVFLIKPKARRFWLQSIALRDADDTFIDLKKAGY